MALDYAQRKGPNGDIDSLANPWNIVQKFLDDTEQVKKWGQHALLRMRWHRFSGPLLRRHRTVGVPEGDPSALP